MRAGPLSTDARAVVRLVEELRWLHSIVDGPPARAPRARAVKLAAADVIECAADRLDLRDGSHAALSVAMGALHSAVRELERAANTAVDVSALDPSFRAREAGFVGARIAEDACLAADAAERSWAQRLLGRGPVPSLATPFRAAAERAGAHLARTSNTLHNSIRGAVALGASVLVADLIDVQHGFWVSLGTLAILRSNALSTGENLLRALAGTAVGFLVGGVLVYLVGTNTAVLWPVLPVAILFAGLAPSAISFAAGQAGFTLTLLILFNVIAPAGWRIGIVRIEDVALGGAVSLAVGLMFWPRGAGAGFRRALADAYRAAARYLAQSVADGDARRAALDAGAAAQRLDDAFRGYLGERGAKSASLAETTGLVNGVTGVGLAADGVRELWHGDGDRAAAGGELLAASREVAGWFEDFAAGLAGEARIPAPLPADGRLAGAVARDLPGGGATGVRVIWTGDHLDAVRRLQSALVTPAAALSQSD